ncbi:MAG: DUF2892 domain-containing protein [Caldilineaceae bacterium]
MLVTEALALFQAVNANVGEKERVGSIVSGAALVVSGWQRRTFMGYVSALVGLYLFIRGLTGYCLGYKGLGINKCGDNPDLAL